MFGGTGGGGTFTFGATTTTTQAQPTAGNAAKPATAGFSFGNTGATGGFTFGGAQQTPAASTTAAPSLFATPTAVAPSTGGFSFGAAAAAAAAPKPATTSAPPAGGFSFGAPASTSQTSASTGFTLGGATTAAAGQQKPAGFSFGPTATSTPATTTTMGGMGFKLGASTSAPGIRPTVTPTVTPGGSFTFGNTASTAGVAPRPTLGVPATSTPATTAAALSFNLTTPQQPAATTTAPTATKHTLGGAPAPGFGPLKLGTTTGTSTATVTPSVGFSLGGTATTTTTASTGLTLGAAATSAAPAGGLGLSFGTKIATAATGAVQPAGTTAKLPQMNYRQLEECINKWTVELQEQEKIFLQQATQVNAWDRLLMENGEKITQLNSDVERVKMDQQRLDHELDFIRAQQRELEELLSPLESSVQQLPSISYQQHADLEREHTYQMAENIDVQLKRMVQDLKDIIDHVNSTNSSQDNNDPIHQITKILNAHMDSLQWIDENSSLLNRRVEDISKQMELQRKEQERNFRLAYD